MLTRNLLVVDLAINSSEKIRYSDILKDWELFETTGVPQSKVLLQSREFCVGLVLLDNSYSFQTKAIEDLLLADHCMEWIAVLPSDSLKNSSFCELLTDNFYDYHTRPIDVSRLRVALGHAYGKARLKKERLASKNESTGAKFRMIGESPPMQKLFEKMRRIQRSDAPLIIQGDSGTGKELAARAIHENSNRKSGPFIAVNCGALPASLIQSELFGHEKGAFTGAAHKNIGRLEAADGGTIFLDEIGDFPAELQVNLLRFLQEKTIERLGSTRSVPVDVRVISATHANLEAAVKHGTFREDLFYRLHVLTLHLPPLRERDLDIELLAKAFLDQYAVKGKYGAKCYSRQAIEYMLSYSWPGNVRELINRVQKAVVLSENRLITVADLGFDPDKKNEIDVSLNTARYMAEQDIIRRCLAMNNNNVARTARYLGVSRMTVYRLISKHRNASLD